MVRAQEIVKREIRKGGWEVERKKRGKAAMRETERGEGATAR